MPIHETICVWMSVSHTSFCFSIAYRRMVQSINSQYFAHLLSSRVQDCFQFWPASCCFLVNITAVFLYSCEYNCSQQVMHRTFVTVLAVWFLLLLLFILYYLNYIEIQNLSLLLFVRMDEWLFTFKWHAFATRNFKTIMFWHYVCTLTLHLAELTKRVKQVTGEQTKSRLLTNIYNNFKRALIDCVKQV